MLRLCVHVSFAVPAGITDDVDIRTAASITDYIVRRLALDYLPFDDRLELGLASIDDMPEEQTSLIDEPEVDTVDSKEVATETINTNRNGKTGKSSNKSSIKMIMLHFVLIVATKLSVQVAVTCAPVVVATTGCN